MSFVAHVEVTRYTHSDSIGKTIKTIKESIYNEFISYSQFFEYLRVLRYGVEKGLYHFDIDVTIWSNGVSYILVGAL